jgi:hypothetical protein
MYDYEQFPPLCKEEFTSTPAKSFSVPSVDPDTTINYSDISDPVMKAVLSINFIRTCLWMKCHVDFFFFRMEKAEPASHGRTVFIHQHQKILKQSSLLDWRSNQLSYGAALRFMLMHYTEIGCISYGILLVFWRSNQLSYVAVLLVFVNLIYLSLRYKLAKR